MADKKERLAMYCICCEKPIPYLDESGFEDSTNLDEGVRGEIHGGWGSGHDFHRFLIAVCDACLTKKIELGMAYNMGRYNWANPDE